MHYLAFGKFSFQIWKWIGIFFVKYGHILIFKLPLYFCQKTETYQTSWKPRLDSCIPSRRINTCKSKNAEKQCLQYFANRGRDLQDSWGGKGCLESASSTVLLQQVLSEPAGQAVVQLASGNLQDWKLNNVSGDLLKRISCTVLLQFHLALKESKQLKEIS